MKCLFGHKFGKMETYGVQYCMVCCFARIVPVPAPAHPCENGHIWEEVSSMKYEGGNGWDSWIDYRLALKCKVCGSRDWDWKFGH